MELKSFWGWWHFGQSLLMFIFAPWGCDISCIVVMDVCGVIWGSWSEGNTIVWLIKVMVVDLVVFSDVPLMKDFILRFVNWTWDIIFFLYGDHDLSRWVLNKTVSNFTYCVPGIDISCLVQFTYSSLKTWYLKNQNVLSSWYIQKTFCFRPHFSLQS